MNELARRMLTAMLLAGFFVWATWSPFVFMLLWAALSMWILFVEWPRIAPWYTGMIYPGLPLLLAAYLYWSVDQRYLVWVAVISGIIFDTGSYIMGRRFGQHHITRISPQKTWEGVIGGFLTLLLVGALATCPSCIVSSISKFSIFTGIIILLSAAAFFGDLFISWQKRKNNRKDCSSILPGHGGALDRCDSILGCIPVVYGLYLFDLI